MNKKLQNNLIFLHLPKNGGATLNALLNRMYPKKIVHQIRLKDSMNLTTQEFIDLPEKERAKIKVLKGHMFYGLHEHLIGASEYITFLRLPEKRILSFYNFVKKRPNHRLYKEVAESNMSFSDFVEVIDAGDIHNAQIRFISGLKDADEDTMLKTAIKHIDQHFSFVGLQEYYDESLILLKDRYNWSIPFYTYKNKMHKTVQHQQIDELTIKRISEKNAGDIKLYQYVEKRIEQEILMKKNMKQALLKLKIANALADKTWGRRFLNLMNL